MFGNIICVKYKLLKLKINNLSVYGKRNLKIIHIIIIKLSLNFKCIRVTLSLPVSVNHITDYGKN